MVLRSPAERIFGSSILPLRFLLNNIVRMELKPGKYRHYKGKEYEVIGVAEHTETQENLVVYRALYDEHKLYARPLKMFEERVTVDGLQKPRFEFIGE